MSGFKKVNGFKEHNKIQIATRLDPADFALVIAAARQEDVSVSEAIRKIVKFWVKQRRQLVQADAKEAAE